MKTSICKAFPFVFTKKATVTKNDMINFISRTFSIESMPFFLGLLSLPKKFEVKHYIIWALCLMIGVRKSFYTDWPRLVCSRRVTSVEAPGQVQLFASSAYLNSSSHTTNSANFTCNLFSGRKI